MVDRMDLFWTQRYPSWGILLRHELADAAEVARYGRYSATRSHTHIQGKTPREVRIGAPLPCPRKALRFFFKLDLNSTQSP